MATVCVRVQSAEKCLVSWTIFQMEGYSLSLSELFENIKSGRVSIIVPSSELSTAQLEKVFIGNPKRSLQISIQVFNFVMYLSVLDSLSGIMLLFVLLLPYLLVLLHWYNQIFLPI